MAKNPKRQSRDELPEPTPAQEAREEEKRSGLWEDLEWWPDDMLWNYPPDFPEEP